MSTKSENLILNLGIHMMEEKNWFPTIECSQTFTHAQWKVHAVPTINNGKNNFDI